jgi:hypothetical protein
MLALPPEIARAAYLHRSPALLLRLHQPPSSLLAWEIFQIIARYLIKNEIKMAKYRLQQVFGQGSATDTPHLGQYCQAGWVSVSWVPIELPISERHRTFASFANVRVIAVGL